MQNFLSPFLCQNITHGRRNDIAILDQLVFEPGAFYLTAGGILVFSAFVFLATMRG